MATLILNLETEIKPYLDAGDASSDDEAFLEQMEANMIGMIEADTNWRFRLGGTSEAFVVKGIGGYRLWLPLRPTGSVTVATRASLTASWEALESTAHELSASRTSLVRIDGSEWPDGDALIRVTATWGYAVADVPGDVKQLLLEMLNWMYRRGRKTFGEQQILAQMRKETNYDMVLRKYRSPLYG